MAATAGWNAQVYITGTPVLVGNLTSAEINVAGEIYDITSLGNQWKQKIGGLVDYTIKLAGNFDMSDAQQATLQGYIVTNPGTIATWSIAPKGNAPTQRYSGTIIIKTMALKFAVNAKEDISFDGDSTGPLVFVA